MKRHRKEHSVWKRKTGRHYTKRLSGPPSDFATPGTLVSNFDLAPLLGVSIMAALRGRRPQAR